MSAQLLPALVLVPLVTAAVTALVPARARAAVTIAGALVTAVGVGVLWAEVVASGRVEMSLAGWDVPLGIGLVADAPSALMLALSAVIVLAVAAYAAADERVRGTPAFWTLLCTVQAALNGVFVAGDLFTVYVMLELLTLSAVALVALGGGAAPALRYLFIAVVGSLLYLLAVALVYAEAGTLDLQLAAERMDSGPLVGTVLVLTTVGMAAKMALFPLHSWLPVAHPAAPAAVSAVLSALVIKASLFVLWRVFAALGPLSMLTPTLATAAAVAGSVGVIWGGVMALRRRRLKTIIAYSTVAQVGYLVLILPLMQPGPGADAGWSGGILLAVAHGLAKGAMFLAAGALLVGYGTDRLDGLEGAVTRMPLAVAALGIAGVSLAGLPPTVGFVAKWQLLLSSLASGQWWWIPVLLVGGLLTFGYTAMMIRATFNPPDGERPEPAVGRPPAVLSIAPFALAVISLVLGVAPLGLFDGLAASLPWGGAA